MISRVVVAVALLAALGTPRDGFRTAVVHAQATSSVTLVNVPIPAYPPIARSAAISGDVRVTVAIRQDGTVASASIAGLDVVSRDPVAKSLGQPALYAARDAQFHCDNCIESTTPYSFVFAFRFAERIGRAAGDAHPEVVTVSPSQSRVLIVTEMPLCCDGPRTAVYDPRRARCLWLWHCNRVDPGVGPAELIPTGMTEAVYPVAARAEMASADIEVRVGVRRDGKVATADVVSADSPVSLSPGIETAFRSAALAAARQPTFVCRRCTGGTLPYSIVYSFRFDGVLESLDRGYAASIWSTPTPSQSRLVVAAHVPTLEAALAIRADALPAGCHLATALPSSRDLPVTANPWLGDDRPTISAVTMRIAGPPQMPDGPPLGAAASWRYLQQLGEGVKQAYVASYAGAGRGAIDVYGLLFGDENDAKAFVESTSTSGSTTLALHRQIVVSVQGTGACAGTITAVLKARAKPQSTGTRGDGR